MPVAVAPAILLCWLALKPLTDALYWSWQHYEEARLQADQARDNQAELKLALADLAEAGANMVRLNEMLGVARRVAEDADHAPVVTADGEGVAVHQAPVGPRQFRDAATVEIC